MTRLSLRSRLVLLLTVICIGAWASPTVSAQPVNDPFFSDQQYLQAVEVPAVWSITTGDSNQKIAIIGGGNVFPSHEDLGAKTTVRTQGHLEGLPGQPIPFDDQPSLGTVAGGMAAALTNNGLGVAGVNWNASILSYNPAVLDFDPDLNVASNIQVLDLGAVDESFDMARSDGADLIVAPLTVFSDADPGVTVETDLGEEPIEVLGVTIPAWVVGAGESIFGLIRDGLSFNSPWNDAHFAARNVVATGHPLIAPAGNFEGSAYTFPASTARNEIAISVGSTDNFKNPSQFSGSSLSSSPLGATVDVVAPGENVKTTVNTGPSAYKTVSTTSASAGLVAGVASLLQSYDPAMAPSDIRQILRRTAEDIPPQGFDAKTGFGFVNAKAAFDYVQERTITRGVVTNGTAVKVADDYQLHLISGPWSPLPAGPYLASDVYKVTFTVNLPAGSEHDMWARVEYTNGWSFANPNNGDPYANVSIDLASGTATITTYVYENVSNTIGQVEDGLPVTASNAKVAYTIATKPGTPDLPPETPSNLVITNAGQINQNPQLDWDDNTESDLDHYTVYRCPSHFQTCT